MKNPSPKNGIMSISPYVAGKSEIAGNNGKIIKLSSNENSLGASPLAIKAVIEGAENIIRYPDSGSLELRNAIAKRYNIPAEQVVCGNGSDELIGLLVNGYAGEGDEVLFSEYGFLMYKIYTQAAGATPVMAKENNMCADIDALLAKVTERTKILFIANPNNPTGSYLTTEELNRLRAELPEHILLVIDAAYSEYVDLPDYSNGFNLVHTTENTVMLRTFSKIYGLAALRIGWAYCPKNIADVINRIRGPFNVSAIAQSAGIAAIQDQKFLDYVKTHNNSWLEWVSGALTEIGLQVYDSIANFVLVEFPKNNKNAKAANDFLLSKGIIVREVSGYGLNEHLRITIGTKEENEALVAALKEFMAS